MDTNTTELFEAVEGGCVEKLRDILSRADVNVNSKNSNDETALHVVVRTEHEDVLRLLLEAGADVSLKDHDGSTPLHSCCLETCHPEKSSVYVRILVEAGADVNGRNNYNLTGLHLAATCTKNVDLVRYLLELGADVNAKTTFRWTALHYAVKNFGAGSLQFVEALLSAGANVNATNMDFETPLHLLIVKILSGPLGCPILEALDVFSKYGADFAARTRDGRTVLDLVTQGSQGPWDVNLIRALIERGAGDVNSVCVSNYVLDRPGQTILHRACLHRSFEVVKYLVEAGANINALDDDHATPLFYALCSARDDREADLIRYFLEQNPDVNVITLDGSNIFVYIHQDIPFSIRQIVLEHLAKEKVLGKRLHPDLLRTMSDNPEDRDYFQKCSASLENLKSDKIYAGSSLTWFNLLMDPESILKNYSKNEVLVSEFKKTDLCEKYPVFGVMINQRFGKVLDEKEVREKSEIVLSNLLPPVLALNHIIFSKIFSHFELEELRILCKDETEDEPS